MWLCFDTSGISTPTPIFVVAGTSCCFVMSSNTTGLICHTCWIRAGGCRRHWAFPLCLRFGSNVHTQYFLGIFIAMTGLMSCLLNRQQRTTENLPRHTLKHIHLPSGAVGVCWYLLVTAHLQIKNWTWRWARCRSVWNVLSSFNWHRIIAAPRSGWRFTRQLVLCLLLQHSPQVELELFVLQLARNLNTVLLSCFETQDYHNKDREGSTLWQTNLCLQTSLAMQNTAILWAGLSCTFSIQRERESQFLKTKAKANKLPQNYLNKEHQKASFVNVKLIWASVSEGNKHVLPPK